MQYETRVCSKECYKNEAKRLLWDYKFKIVKKNFVSLLDSTIDFVTILFKLYTKDVLITAFKFSILFMVYFTLSEIIYLIETYVN